MILYTDIQILKQSNILATRQATSDLSRASSKQNVFCETLSPFAGPEIHAPYKALATRPEPTA